jgi:hypothetical protein
MKIKLSELRKVIKEETAQEQFALTAQEEAEKINAQTGASYITDQSYWEELGISTGEDLALSILHQTYSDTYKSLHGIRPRWAKFNSVAEAQKAIDDLDKEAELISADDENWLEKEAEWEKERQKLSDLEAPGLDLDYQKLSKQSGMGRRMESVKKERTKTMKITKKQLVKIIKEEKAKLLNENSDVNALRFEDIMLEIEDLALEALKIARTAPGMTGERAKRYWFGHIISAIGSNQEYAGGSAATMQNTLEELSGLDDESMMQQGYEDGLAGKSPAYPDNELYKDNYDAGTAERK